MPVYVTIEKPAVVLALTVDVIVPDVFETVEPAAFHCQATCACELWLGHVPIWNPSELNAVTPVDNVDSAEVWSEDSNFVAPRTESYKAWLKFDEPLLAFCQTKSGWNEVDVVLFALLAIARLLVPSPVQSVAAKYEAPSVIVGVGRLVAHNVLNPVGGV